MTDGFQVMMSDLRAAAGKFQAAARTFAGALPASGPAPADGGSWVVNDALSMALESIGLLHAQFTATIENDAANLEANCEVYQSAEDAITRLVTAVAAPDRAG